MGMKKVLRLVESLVTSLSLSPDLAYQAVGCKLDPLLQRWTVRQRPPPTAGPPDTSMSSGSPTLGGRLAWTLGVGVRRGFKSRHSVS